MHVHIFVVIRQVNPTTVVTSSNQDERFTKVLQGLGRKKFKCACILQMFANASEETE